MIIFVKPQKMGVIYKYIRNNVDDTEASERYKLFIEPRGFRLKYSLILNY